jgi:glycosyltransferase involved in cell wall biosynthesis
LKGVDLLATGFREISKTITNARLLIVGSGAEEKYIRPVLAKEISRGLVRIEPDVDHEKLSEWYGAMELLVMPSRYENFSNAVIEAMACGIPFLASNIGGNRILAKTGAGWLFEQGSAPSLTSCLVQILEDSSEMRKRGTLGQDYVLGCHTWKISAQRLEEIIMSHRARIGMKCSH